MSSMIMQVIDAFIAGWRHGHYVSRKATVRADKKVRAQLSDKQVDQMLKDTFPASDPPATY